MTKPVALQKVDPVLTMETRCPQHTLMSRDVTGKGKRKMDDILTSTGNGQLFSCCRCLGGHRVAEVVSLCSNHVADANSVFGVIVTAEFGVRASTSCGSIVNNDAALASGTDDSPQVPHTYPSNTYECVSSNTGASGMSSQTKNEHDRMRVLEQVVGRHGFCATECGNTRIIAQRFVTWSMYEFEMAIVLTHLDHILTIGDSGEGPEILACERRDPRERAIVASVPFEKALADILDHFKPSLAGDQDFLEKRPPRLSPGINDLVQKLKERGKKAYLISGGFRQMINVISQKQKNFIWVYQSGGISSQRSAIKHALKNEIMWFLSQIGNVLLEQLLLGLQYIRPVKQLHSDKELLVKTDQEAALDLITLVLKCATEMNSWTLSSRTH
ncbi:3-phosphoserine phosphatase [Artemisia annua]|uniref:phosphoserine phosphatase n=1 Tax=Artemisia annua TaxID=35608 RepID=A0A2U1N3N3_ARTAN|nr:3-phosphoserine phosphatase [Artemisia annua]